MHFMDRMGMFFDHPDSEHEVGNNRPSIKIEVLLEQILRLRGDRATTVRDIVDLQTFGNWKLFQKLNEHEASFQRALASFEACLEGSKADVASSPKLCGAVNAYVDLSDVNL